MKILIVCVNYNSYDELRRYLKSIDDAAVNIAGKNEVIIKVADNSSDFETIRCKDYQYVNVEQVKLNNLGYLGGAQAIINSEENIDLYQYVIISNVDLAFTKSTLKILVDFNLNDKVAWVAPSIYSGKYQKDLNPNVIFRYPKWKLFFLKLTYNKLFFRLYTNFFFAKKGKKYTTSNQMDIYAGHGAVIILTSNFFKVYKRLTYPIFLYGEELYFAELINRKKLKVVYVPAIKIQTSGGVSTSKLPSSSFFKYNKDAINYLLKEFY